MTHKNFRVVGLTLLLTSLSVSTPSASAADTPDYWSCYYGVGTSPRYLSDVFHVDFYDKNLLHKNRDAFMDAVISEFGKHPQIAKAREDYRPQCTARKTRSEAENLLKLQLDSMSGRSISIFDTQWTPHKGVQNTEPYYVPEK